MAMAMSKDDGTDTRSKERKEIDEWMYGSGSKVMGGVLLLLAGYFVVTLFI